MKWFELLLALGCGAFAVTAAETSSAAAPLAVGSTPPEWEAASWINSAPLELRALRGRVVLIRFWTAPECPYCRATAPGLNAFFEQYHKEGLDVIGLYHHKSARPLIVEDVRRYVSDYGFKFPVAIDTDWKTLKRWWLSGDSKDKWTSVTFLLDRSGIVRYIHPGGQYVKGDGKYEELEAKIAELLKEKIMTYRSKIPELRFEV